MGIDVEKGVLLNVRQVASPNYNERPLNTDIDLVVIHNISLPPGEFGGPYIDAFFTNTLDPSQHSYFEEIATMEVSSHCFISRDGSITQYVPFIKRAWHAGISQFSGREDCNDFSIGIELEGTDSLPYDKLQYFALARLVALLQRSYPKITWDRIVGHSTIAPGRKTDPGPAFDWKLFLKLLTMDSKHSILSKPSKPTRGKEIHDT
jgi:AmpD protein